MDVEGMMSSEKRTFNIEISMDWDVYVRLVEETQKRRIAIAEIVEACLRERYGSKLVSMDGSVPKLAS